MWLWTSSPSRPRSTRSTRRRYLLNLETVKSVLGVRLELVNDRSCIVAPKCGNRTPGRRCTECVGRFGTTAARCGVATGLGVVPLIRALSAPLACRPARRALHRGLRQQRGAARPPAGAHLQEPRRQPAGAAHLVQEQRPRAHEVLHARRHLGEHVHVHGGRVRQQRRVPLRRHQHHEPETAVRPGHPHRRV